MLDCYAGSGTTLAVADEMQRRWIGMDNSLEALSAMLKRFEQGLLPMGDYVQKREDSENSVLQQPVLFDTFDESTLSSTSRENTAHTY